MKTVKILLILMLVGLCTSCGSASKNTAQNSDSDSVQTTTLKSVTIDGDLTYQVSSLYSPDTLKGTPSENVITKEAVEIDKGSDLTTTHRVSISYQELGLNKIGTFDIEIEASNN
ncbi:hypothetical protein DID80_06970 [Candidatus Marinamargulisbacteria bacterium SCGC AAA071-K20]|nr:hypothetical protein DID80_06970 [Candidatus Marinamargulisbacteria bacterium SCGC AAA071-K20]